MICCHIIWKKQKIISVWSEINELDCMYKVTVPVSTPSIKKKLQAVQECMIIKQNTNVKLYCANLKTCTNITG